jgi:precorrin-4 methylase
MTLDFYAGALVAIQLKHWAYDVEIYDSQKLKYIEIASIVSSNKLQMANAVVGLFIVMPRQQHNC